jgi:hypothetical protein
MVVEPVLSELVSGGNFPANRERTGKIPENGGLERAMGLNYARLSDT